MAVIKHASLQELAQSALSSAKGEIESLRQKPFETLFRYIGPSWAFFRGHWVLGIILGIAENLLGFGPSKIGAMIDEHLGFGGTKSPEQITDENALSAATKVYNYIFGGAIGKSEFLRARIIKGNFEISDLVTAWALGPDIKKTAVHPMTKWRSLLGIRSQKGFFISTIYQFIKFVLLGLAAAIGIKFVAKEVKEKVPSLAPETFRGLTTPPKPGMRLYTNPANSVEQSLVMALDNLIKTKTGEPFSKLFEDLKGYSPIGSSEMQRVLAKVRESHGGAPIQEISGYKTFAAPPLVDIATMLLPQATYSKSK